MWRCGFAVWSNKQLRNVSSSPLHSNGRCSGGGEGREDIQKTFVLLMSRCRCTSAWVVLPWTILFAAYAYGGTIHGCLVPLYHPCCLFQGHCWAGNHSGLSPSPLPWRPPSPRRLCRRSLSLKRPMASLCSASNMSRSTAAMCCFTSTRRQVRRPKIRQDLMKRV